MSEAKELPRDELTKLCRGGFQEGMEALLIKVKRDGAITWPSSFGFVTMSVNAQPMTDSERIILKNHEAAANREHSIKSWQELSS